MVPTSNLRPFPKSASRIVDPILDSFQSPVVAYSFRRLSSAFYGFPALARLQGSLTQRDIPFYKHPVLGDFLDYREAAQFGNPSVLNDSVQLFKWYDQSGNQRDADLVGNTRCFLADATNSNSVYTYPFSEDEKIEFSPYSNKNIIPASALFFNSDAELRGYKFAAPSTNFSFIIVATVRDITGNNRNVIFTDGAGFNVNGMYLQTSSLQFCRAGGTSSIGSLDFSRVRNGGYYIISVKHFSNNTAMIAVNDGQWSAITSVGAWVNGDKTTLRLGSYYGGATRSSSISLSGFISELVAWNTTDIDLDEYRFRTCKYYGIKF